MIILIIIVITIIINCMVTTIFFLHNIYQVSFVTLSKAGERWTFPFHLFTFTGHTRKNDQIWKI